MEGKKKQELTVLQAHSLRDLVDKVNAINISKTNAEDKILKEDIVDIILNNEAVFLMYYR